MIFASAGYQVSMFDIDQNQVAGALDIIRSDFAHLHDIGLSRGLLTPEEQIQRIAGTTNLEECVKGAMFVQESVPERIDLKKSVWSKVDDLVEGNDVILSSSTSAIVPSILSDELRHRKQFIVSHPTNPPFYAPLVEVVPAPWTDKNVVNKTMNIMKEIGQVPVLVKKEINGFVLNRIQDAILGETYRLIEDGVMSVGDIDKVMSDGLGVRYAFMGPWQTAFINADGMHSYMDRYADMILGIQQSFGAPRRMGGATVDLLQEELSKWAPMDKLDEMRRWRDKRLSSLAKLKQTLDSEDQ